MENWIPALTSSVLLAAIVFLCRNMIIERLKNAVKHEYDAKLTKLKSDLESKQKDIEAIRSGALSSVSQRQDILYRRQLQAIEGLWDAVQALGPAKAMSMTLITLNYDNALEAAANDPKAREMFQALSPLELEDMPRGNAVKERPFLSPLVWAYYAAYEAIVTHAALRMHMLKKGLNYKQIIHSEHVEKLVKAALPTHVEYIEKHGSEGFHYLLELLESKILESINLMLDGKDNDLTALRKAAEITKRAEELAQSTGDA